MVLARPSESVSVSGARPAPDDPVISISRAVNSALSTPANMALARTPVSAAPASPQASMQDIAPSTIGREVNVTEPIVSPTQADSAGGDRSQETAQLAEKIFAMLERRLLVERERGGFRRA
jgi:hypothetical protein